MVPRIGTEFAGYRILALLGRGGMSVVYRAENQRLGMTVALKILAPELADDEAFRERFVSESRLVAALHHPRIVTVHETGEADGCLFIAMRCFKTDLRSVLDAGELPPARRTAALVRDVSGALDAAAAEGLVHRDVKPANILLDALDGDAYLADFGVAKRTTATGPTERGQVLGTIAYMSPEQIAEREVDGRSDQYALGCVAFECLTGMPPFRRENDAAVLWAHMQEPPPAAGRVRPGLPDGLDAVLEQAMAKLPEERFGSCTELAAALEEAARGGHPVPSRVAAVEAPARSRWRRPRLALGTAAALALLAAGLLAALVLPGGQPSSAATEDAVTTLPSATVTAGAPRNELTAFDTALLATIPDEASASCEHVDPISTSFDSTLRCTVRGLGAEVLYSHARSGDVLREHLRDQVVEAGISLSDTDGLTAGGRCPGSLPALQEWRMDGHVGHREVNSQQLVDSGMSRGELQRTVIGHVLCYEENGEFRLQWSDRRAGVYAHAVGEPAPLTRWWRRAAGPQH